jgi:hypothetical protein
VIKLINGRGQLGHVLNKRLTESDASSPISTYIYHTWNIQDRSKPAQSTEYEKFKLFTDRHNKSKIIFVSTTSEKDCWYVHYKNLAESYLLQNCENGIVVKFPILIGRGILTKLRNEEVEPYGEMGLICMKDAADKILELTSYGGAVKIFTYNGEILRATTVQNLMLLGKTGAVQ